MINPPIIPFRKGGKLKEDSEILKGEILKFVYLPCGTFGKMDATVAIKSRNYSSSERDESRRYSMKYSSRKVLDFAPCSHKRGNSC